MSAVLSNIRVGTRTAPDLGWMQDPLAFLDLDQEYRRTHVHQRMAARLAARLAPSVRASVQSDDHYTISFRDGGPPSRGDLCGRYGWPPRAADRSSGEASRAPADRALPFESLPFAHDANASRRACAGAFDGMAKRLVTSAAAKISSSLSVPCDIVLRGDSTAFASLINESSSFSCVFLSAWLLRILSF